MKKSLLAITSALAMTIALSAYADEIVGQASVIDGDTIEIHGQRIRFHGIDAPESSQLCEQDGREYRCGQKASLALADKIGRAIVRCEKRATDRYKRVIGVCFSSNENLNRWMVRSGWAVAYRRYSKDYVRDEDFAREGKVGIWSGAFEMPFNWRRRSQ